MFDAVLEKSPRQQWFGTSTMLTIGVHGGIIALVAFLTGGRPPPAELKEPAIVFKHAAARPAARGTPLALPHHAATPTRRPNAIIPPKSVPTTQPVATSVEAAPVVGALVGAPDGSGDTLGVPDGLPGGDPDATSTEPQDVVEECNPDCAFGVGMTRPVIPTGVFGDVYSRSAIEAQVEGMMIVKCRVGVDGAMKNCRVLKPLPHLTEAVLRRLESVRATPSYIEGHAVPVDYVFNFSFKLPR